MLLHEIPELEDGVLSGDFDIAIPVSIFVPHGGGECEITAYNAVWDICQRFDEEYKADPLSKEGTRLLCDKVAGVIKSYGYTYDPGSSRIINEYSCRAVSPDLCALAGDAKIISDAASELAGLRCNLLHPPEAEGVDEYDICAVVVRDNTVVSCAGVNDLSDDGAIEIHVETDKKYRGKGYAAMSVAALSMSLIRSGSAVSYKCAESNGASVRVAEKLGFAPDGKRLSMVFRAGERISDGDASVHKD